MHLYNLKLNFDEGERQFVDFKKNSAFYNLKIKKQ